MYPNPERHTSIYLTLNMSLTELNGIKHPFKVKYILNHGYRGKNPEHNHLCPQYMGKGVLLKCFNDSGLQKTPRILG